MSNIKEAVDDGDDHDVNADVSVGKAGQDSCLDIMAQQLKFIGCLKIMMEELSTLATGFEVDGGLLRYQLYIWLEREVEALKQLCNYGATDSHIRAEQPAATDSLQAMGTFILCQSLSLSLFIIQKMRFSTSWE